MDYTLSLHDALPISPPLQWTGAPANTKSFVLIVDDPDAPMGTWDHWVLFNIAPTVNVLSEAVDSKAIGIPGKTSFGKQSYGGPCPPFGTHHYHFKLYALDKMLDLVAGSSKQDVEHAMQGHILAQADLVGLYHRN